MERIIWLIGKDKKEIIGLQRLVNSTGSMRAVCLLSFEAVKREIHLLIQAQGGKANRPSLVVLDYEMSCQEDDETLLYLKSSSVVAGVPLFFMTEKRSREQDAICYKKGAIVVLAKPFSMEGILRMERMAWQHDVTKNYENLLQKQSTELQATKKIRELNEKLETRNLVLHKVLGRYFSDEVVEVILEEPKGADIGGKKEDVAVMLADLRGFTSLSEEMDSEQVTELMNYYFEIMLDVILSYHGTVIEFLGDGILAIFGAPVSLEHKVDAAVAAGLEMQNNMDKVNEFCEKKGLPIVEMGIGIHYGDVFVGNIGSERMMRYNVIGKTVNECSRIESYSVGGQVLVSESTLEQANSHLTVENRFDINSKGIMVPITICQVTGIDGIYHIRSNYHTTEELYQISDSILFNLFRLQGKKVSNTPITARVTFCSQRKAIVQVEEESCFDGEQLNLFDDVEIVATGEKGKVVFMGAYAKIIKLEQQLCVLQFTYVNSGVKQFIEELALKHDQNAGQ